MFAERGASRRQRSHDQAYEEGAERLLVSMTTKTKRVTTRLLGSEISTAATWTRPRVARGPSSFLPELGLEEVLLLKKI